MYFPGTFIPAVRIEGGARDAAVDLFSKARRCASELAARPKSRPTAVWSTIVCISYSGTDYVLFLADTLDAYALSGNGFRMPCAWFYGAVLEGEIFSRTFFITNPLLLGGERGFLSGMNIRERFVELRPGLLKHEEDHAAAAAHPALRLEADFKYEEMDAYQCKNCHSFDLVERWEDGETTCTRCGVVKWSDMPDTRPPREPVDGTIYTYSVAKISETSKRDFCHHAAGFASARAGTSAVDAACSPKKKPRRCDASAADKTIEAFSTKFDAMRLALRYEDSISEVVRGQATSLFTWCLAAQEACGGADRTITMRSLTHCVAVCVYFAFKVGGFERVDSEVCRMFSTTPGVNPKAFRSTRDDLTSLLNNSTKKHPDLSKILARPDPAAALPRILESVCGGDDPESSGVRITIARILSTRKFVAAKESMTNRASNVVLGALVTLAAEEAGWIIPDADIVRVLGYTAQTIADARKQAHAIMRKF